jgi:outer membrane protein
MKRIIYIISMFMVIPAFGVPLVNLDLNLGVMNHEPSGYIEYPANTGDRLDLINDLGIRKSTNIFARGKLEIGILGVYGAYMPINFRGEKSTSQTVNFGGSNFDLNQTIKTDLKLDRYDLGLHLNVPFLGTLTMGVLDVEFGVTGRFLTFQGSVTGKVGGVGKTETVQGSSFIPMLYVGGALNVSAFSLILEGRGIEYQGAQYYDFTGELRFSPFSLPGLAKFYAGLGYRMERLVLKEVFDTNADIQIRSPYVNVGVSF